MNKRDLNAVLLASVLGSAIFVAPVMAQEVAQDPLDVDNPVMETSVTSGWWNDYYIDNGDGSVLSNWRKEIARAVVEQWNPTETYQEGDTVHLGGKLYNALKDVPAGISPAINEEYWQCICGETETVRYIFKEVSEIILYTEIRNPKFQVIIGDFVVDDEGNYVLDPETGLVMLENQEIIDCHIRERVDIEHREGGGLANNDGCPYELRFIEKSQPVKLTGVVNIK